MAKTVFTAGQAARALGVSLDTLRRWDRQGRIRVERDTNRIRFTGVISAPPVRSTPAGTL